MNQILVHELGGLKSDLTRVEHFSDCQVLMDEALEDREWDTFLTQVEGGHHVQSSMWGRLKYTLKWTLLRFKLMDKSSILGGAQLLVRHYPVFGKVAYCARGPILKVDDVNLKEMLLQSIIQECRLRKIKILTIQPPVNDADMGKTLLEHGFRLSTLELAPTASVLVDCTQPEEKLFAVIHSRTRNNIRFSQRNGVTIRPGTCDDLRTFYELHCSTAARQRFMPNTFEYFDTMQRLFEPNHNFQLLFAEVAGEPVSVLLLIPFGDTVLAKRNGWSGKHRELKPNDLIYWAGIQWSRQNGYHYFDLEGVDRAGAMTILAGKPLPDHLRECYDQLKYRYGGQVVLYPEAYDLIRLNPILYFLYTHLRFEVGTSAFISKILDLLRNR